MYYTGNDRYEKIGVFLAAVINKRQYWPRHVPGQEINNYTKKKEIVDVASLHAKLDEYNYDIFE